jgi:hypothetical protein
MGKAHDLHDMRSMPSSLGAAIYVVQQELGQTHVSKHWRASHQQSRQFGSICGEANKPGQRE